MEHSQNKIFSVTFYISDYEVNSLLVDPGNQ